MALHTRFYGGDEELGKRDDDHKLRAKPRTAWYHRRLLLRRNIKKISLALLVLIAVYYFFKNMPTGLERPSNRPQYSHSQTQGRVSRPRPTASGAQRPGDSSSKIDDHEHGDSPSKIDDHGHGSEEHWFNGPIKFYELAASLHAIMRTGGASNANRNVLFAASSLKSASILLPMACEMAKWKRNDVHFTFMGRHNISMDALKEVNGLDRSCDIWLHDARPDFALESSDFRMEVSCAAALGHITNYMHPQAVIVDNSGLEEKYFLKAMKERSAILERTLIELPPKAGQTLLWFTRLDSSSLNAFNKISIDILIHAQPSAAGSLIRLLRSLSKADYFSSSPPRLTIELPHEVDEVISSYLAESFSWPPSEIPIQGNARQLTLHRRISRHGFTPEESSIRFLEAFWPADEFTSHVLVLSPQAELSPLYYHYLKYTILEYKYSAAAARSLPLHEDLLGISLDLPPTYLNDTTVFIPPTENPSTDIPSFLWASPNSNAALYFGSKWTELHTLTTHLLSSPAPPSKRISTTHPSWLEHLLTLSLTRGYTMLYPRLGADSALATIHNELYHAPEEYSKSRSTAANRAVDDDFTADPAQHLSLHHAELPLARTSLLNLLPPDQLLPDLSSLPLLSWEGRGVDRKELARQAEAFSGSFRREVGRCRDKVPPEVRWLEIGIENLFCDDGEEAVQAGEDASPESTSAVERESTAPSAEKGGSEEAAAVDGTEAS